MNENKIRRGNSICPSPEDQLLENVLKNNTNNIREILLKEKNPSHLLNHIYQGTYQRPILHIACNSSGVNADTVAILIEAGADLDSVYLERNVLQYASLKPNNENILKLLLSHFNDAKNKINEQSSYGNSALHWIVKNENAEKLCGNVKILLESGLDPNLSDARSQSAILIASKKLYKELVKVLIENGKCDLDSHKLPRSSTTARDLILQHNLYEGVLPTKDSNESSTPQNVDQQLKSLLKYHTQDEFLNLLSTTTSNDLNNETLCSFLEECCKNGFDKILIHLLNICTLSESKFNDLVDSVCRRGYANCLETLLNHNGVYIKKSVPIDTVCFLIKSFDNFNQIINTDLCIDHKKCLSLLLKHNDNKNKPLLFDVNEKDVMGNTPIHYAIRYASHEIQESLLKSGATFACRNQFNVMPIDEIDRNFFEKHLNQCMEIRGTNTLNSDEHFFEVVFNYSSLLPVSLNDKSLRSSSVNTFDLEEAEEAVTKENNRKTSVEFQPEIDLIFRMISIPDLRHLIAHPVIVSLLFMKWHRIKCIFYTNLVFYLLFIFSLVGYIFTEYGNQYQKNEKNNRILVYFFYAVLLATFLILILRELFQIYVSRLQYLCNFENIIEIILIILTGCILFIKEPSNDTRKQLSAIAILLAAFETILMIGHHPKLSTNVVMLKTVSVNFFKLLLWYSLLIIAFAMSFNILFTNDSTETYLKTAEINDTDVNFSGAGKSLFKTIVMLTGEFDASSIDFQKYPITSKLLFSLFIFMITIILLNLLNGLAVSDTQKIKEEAELVGHIARAQYIHYVEEMLLYNNIKDIDDEFRKTLFTSFQELFCCFKIRNKNSINRTSILRYLAEKVCLCTRKIIMRPNENGRIFPHQDDIEDVQMKKQKYKGFNNSYSSNLFIDNTGCLVGGTNLCRGIYLDGETIKNTLNIIRRYAEQKRAQQNEFRCRFICECGKVMQLQKESANVF